MSEYNRVYWHKVENGQLWLQYCDKCRKFIFYPRSLCPFCLESNPAWKKSTGKGRVYSYTIVNKSDLPEFMLETPYIYAVIELDEGVKMPAGVVECPLDEIRTELQVELVMIERNGRVLPAFKPVSNS